MLNIRFKEKTNTWPGFVDLFSNLVIILVFLLIVFVFLWTTTNVFNAKSADKKLTSLRQQNAEQTELLAQMTTDEAEARQLLLLAKTQLEILEKEREILEGEKSNLTQQLNIATESANLMQSQLSQLEAEYLTATEANITEREDLTTQIHQLQTQLQTDQTNVEMNEANLSGLQTEIQRLNELLVIAEQRARDQEAEYVEMSNRLNKAMAEKIAELSQYQSQFYSAIKRALRDSNMVDTSSDRFVVPSDILFAKGSFTLSPEGKRQLHLIASAIASLESMIPSDVNWIIRVDGHTDKTPVVPGTVRFRNNTELSLLRAIAVVKELEKAGIQPRRLVPSGFGETAPISTGSDPASLQKNRRIELRLTNP
ncbi:MAG: OmpA family protein [Alphaproteobacteria bacterium]|nr:OmpA family protein [Alphaproteobacteria bacterium]